MKKRTMFAMSLLGCSLMAGTIVFSANACSKRNAKDIDLSIYTAYVEYRNSGGTKTYIDWVKDGSVPKPKDVDRAIYEKGEKGEDVVSAEIDKDGNLVLRLSSGKTIKTALPKVKWHTVNFYLDDLLLEKKQIVHGSKLEPPKLDFEYSDYWYLDRGFKEHWNITSIVGKCLNLYAKIDPSKRFKVTLVDEQFKHPFSPMAVSYGAPYELPKPFDMDSEYDFSGWETMSGKKEIVGQKGSWKIPKDVTLRAKWERKTGIKVDKDGLCEFGLYPKTKITDASLVSRIAASAERSARGNPVVDGYEYLHSLNNYYRVEPVTWVLLNEGDDGKNGYRLITRDAIDSSFINPKAEKIDFKQSPLYQWMNDEMRNSYLTLGSLEKSLVRKIDPNSASSDTVTFITKEELYQENRVPKKYLICRPTDYAKKKEIFSYKEYFNVADWWIGSNHSAGGRYFCAYYFGGHGVSCDKNLGIRPVMRIASLDFTK